MQSEFATLTDDHEKIAVHWQTKPIVNLPGSILKLSRVVVAIRTHYIPTWNSWPARGSITFQKRDNGQDVVRVFIDDGNRLSEQFGRKYEPEPIVVGIDITSRDPFERYCIRQELRRRFSHNYVDPEMLNPATSPQKIIVPGDMAHYLDVVFIPDGPCKHEIDEHEFELVYRALQSGRVKSWE